MLAIICEAYDEEELVDDKGKKDVRTVLRFVPRIAPIKAAIFPLLKKNEEQVRIAREIEKALQPWMTLKDTVTIRHRDSMEQERVAVKDLLHWLIARVR